MVLAGEWLGSGARPHQIIDDTLLVPLSLFIEKPLNLLHHDTHPMERYITRLIVQST